MLHTCAWLFFGSFAELSLLGGLQLPVVQLSRLHLLMFSVHASLLFFSFFHSRKQSDVST